jgi:hypothetical protein
MGQVVALKFCRWSDNGLCIATSIEACVCHRGDRFKSKVMPVTPFLAVSAVHSLDYTETLATHAAECPPPWELPQGASTDLIAFAKTGGPTLPAETAGRTIEIRESAPISLVSIREHARNRWPGGIDDLDCNDTGC